MADGCRAGVTQHDTEVTHERQSTVPKTRRFGRSSDSAGRARPGATPKRAPEKRKVAGSIPALATQVFGSDRQLSLCLFGSAGEYGIENLADRGCDSYA